MSRPPEFEGIKFTIKCLELADGSCPAGDFLDALNDSERRKVNTLFELMGTKGRISNREKFKKLEGSDKIFAFKSYQIRIPCFFAPGRVMLAFGLRKKTDKYKRAEVQRAEDYRRWFFSEGG